MYALRGQALDRLRSYLEPVTTGFTKDIFQPLKSMRITSFEMTYLASYILWTTYDSLALSDRSYQVADNIFDQSA
uniref:NR LBD domain-containing protein n=1 Tax=Acrobeloides nanus TaxID=290746 RepID=A0A914DDI4_9BILA